ncbi:MAG: serine hydrolase [Candidatus Acidiferrales bacterium]
MPRVERLSASDQARYPKLAWNKTISLALCLLSLAPAVFAQDAAKARTLGVEKQQLLLRKLDTEIADSERNLDGVLGVAIEDLTTGQKIVLHPDEIFPQASSIKIAVLAELYRQDQLSAQGQAGRAKLSDLYTVNSADIVPGSDIMEGLTPSVTRLTNRDLATMMIAVSDNSAANVLIDRVGMANVNSLMDTLGLPHTRLRRKMMDLQAAKEGRENVSTPAEMMTLLADIYQGKVLNKQATEDFFKMLATPKASWIPNGIPPGVRVADKPGVLEGVRDDSGIVFAQNRPFVICVMTTYLKNERDGEQAIGSIAASAYSIFDRLGRASEYGRAIPPAAGPNP